jgi:pimeloyl-ACP methyl ester carboxylesterase
MQTMLIPSHGQNLNALMYTAAGAGLHPVALLLHGLPGNEKNLDLAQSMRRAGWNVLFINYRGSWGTPGDFSFGSSTEDVAAALAWLRDPANAQKTASNPKRIVLIGHSMGGFMAAFGTAHDPEVEAVAMISAADMGSQATGPEAPVLAGLAAAFAAEGLEPLKTTAEVLARDNFTYRADWTFAGSPVPSGSAPSC